METAKKRKKGSLKKDLPLWLIALPGIVYLIINNYIPMFGLFLAFKNYNFMKGIFGSDWVGFNLLGSNSPQLCCEQTKRSWGEYPAACCGEVY